MKLISKYFFIFSEGQLSPDIKFLLTNVIYFHDSWVGGSFDRLEEGADPIPDFRLSNGEISDEKPKWMQRSSSHFVLRNITFVLNGGRKLPFMAVSIPYEVSTFIGTLETDAL